MAYRDGMAVELGDLVEVDDSPAEFEPEQATVIKVGKKKIQVESANLLTKYRRFWVTPGDCDLIAREN